MYFFKMNVIPKLKAITRAFYKLYNLLTSQWTWNIIFGPSTLGFGLLYCIIHFSNVSVEVSVILTLKIMLLHKGKFFTQTFDLQFIPTIVLHP